VAPGFRSHDESRPIAKGLTSKTGKLLSKTSLGATDRAALALEDIAAQRAFLDGDWEAVEAMARPGTAAEYFLTKA